MKRHLILLAIACLMLPACEVEYKHHNLEVEAKPVALGGTTVQPSFQPSEISRSPHQLGSPWQLVVISESTRGATSLVIEEASATIDGKRYQLVDPGRERSITYGTIQTGEGYINEEVASLKAQLPPGATGELSISGRIEFRNGEPVPFAGAWAFESIAQEGEFSDNPFLR